MSGPIRPGLSRLVGLGPGFTPSGDDFLTRALLAETILESYNRKSRTQSEKRPEAEGPDASTQTSTPKVLVAGEEIRQCLHKTNYGGSTLLKQALSARFPAYLPETAGGMVEAGDLEGMRRVVTRAAGQGETSGTDACVGLYWFLDLAIRLTGLPG